MLALEKQAMRIDHFVLLSQMNLNMTRASLTTIEKTISDIENGTEEVRVFVMVMWMRRGRGLTSIYL